MRLQRGTTVVELLVGMTILLLLMGAVFSLFEFGTQSFRLSALRQDLQTTSRQILTRIEQEIRLTNLESMSVADDAARRIVVDGAVTRRHALCLATLSDWNDLTLFDANSGMPLWNRYTLYYATLENPQGRLLRVELDTGAPAAGPWAAFAGLPLPDALPVSPFAGATVKRAQSLTSEVLEFALTPDDKAMGCTLKLRRQETTKFAGQKGRDEVFQLDIKTRPRNPLS